MLETRYCENAYESEIYYENFATYDWKQCIPHRCPRQVLT